MVSFPISHAIGVCDDCVCVRPACRENPFNSDTRALATGLAAATAPAGSLLAFATAAGAVADDGRGEHGVYTEQWATAMLQSAKSFESLIKDVAHGVRKATEGQQKPWVESSLIVDFALFSESYPPPASSIAELERVAVCTEAC